MNLLPKFTSIMEAAGHDIHVVERAFISLYSRNGRDYIPTVEEVIEEIKNDK